MPKPRKIAWQVADERATVHGIVQLVRSWSGRRWGVRVWWPDETWEITKHANEKIAREQFASTLND